MTGAPSSEVDPVVGQRVLLKARHPHGGQVGRVVRFAGSYLGYLISSEADWIGDYYADRADFTIISDATQLQEGS